MFIIAFKATGLYVAKYRQYRNSYLKAINMPNYYSYLMRHGEHGVQAIVERIERYEGIRSATNATLEDRWMAVMREASLQPPPMAA